MSEVFRRRPKSADGEVSSPSLRTRINASSLPVLFTSKFRDREEGIVIYSFYTWFSFLTWVWVNVFLEIVSSKMATTHIFQSGVRNWPASVSRREIEVFNPQEWDSRLRRESWQVYKHSYERIQSHLVSTVHNEACSFSSVTCLCHIIDTIQPWWCSHQALFTEIPVRHDYLIPGQE